MIFKGDLSLSVDEYSGGIRDLIKAPKLQSIRMVFYFVLWYILLRKNTKNLLFTYQLLLLQKFTDLHFFTLTNPDKVYTWF
jgi:hypothetical protein